MIILFERTYCCDTRRTEETEKTAVMIAVLEQGVCVLCVLLQIETDSLWHDDTVLSNFVVRGQ